jgi:hypothetical protein
MAYHQLLAHHAQIIVTQELARCCCSGCAECPAVGVLMVVGAAGKRKQEDEQQAPKQEEKQQQQEQSGDQTATSAATGSAAGAPQPPANTPKRPWHGAAAAGGLPVVNTGACN